MRQRAEKREETVNRAKGLQGQRSNVRNARRQQAQQNLQQQAAQVTTPGIKSVRDLGNLVDGIGALADNLGSQIKTIEQKTVGRSAPGPKGPGFAQSAAGFAGKVRGTGDVAGQAWQGAKQKMGNWWQRLKGAYGQGRKAMTSQPSTYQRQRSTNESKLTSIQRRLLREQPRPTKEQLGKYLDPEYDPYDDPELYTEPLSKSWDPDLDLNVQASKRDQMQSWRHEEPDAAVRLKEALKDFLDLT